MDKTDVLGVFTIVFNLMASIVGEVGFLKVANGIFAVVAFMAFLGRKRK